MKGVKKSIQWSTVLGTFLAAMLGAGCRTATTGQIAPSPVTGPVVAPPPTPVSAPARAPEIGAAPAVVRPLNVAVAASASGDGADIVGARVKKAVEGVLVRQGHTLRTTGPENVRITLGVRTRLKDRLGNFYLYSGDVDAAVERTMDGLSLGKRQITGDGKRTLDKTPALQALADVLSAETSQWLTQALDQAAARLEAQDITVKRAWKAGSDAEYSRTFVDQVGRLPGVVSCRNVRQDYSSRTMVFRVVYFKDKFPEGILNRIAVTPALNLKPKD